MTAKNCTSYNQIAFALEILRLLAEKPRRREELADLLYIFLEQHGKSESDILQKLTRTIRKLRGCGIEIRCAPHHPYELIESNFPVILSTEQRQALALAAYFLADMGFSAQASQIIRIGNLKETDQPPNVRVNFSPPVDYSDDKLEAIVRQLQERCRQQRRYTIRYQNTQGEQKTWDIDRSEMRLHNGVLYLFAFVPDIRPRRVHSWPSVEQNLLFRVDRIRSVGPPSNVHWISCEFPTIKICYRMSGPLANYQPRRNCESELQRNLSAKFVDIVTTEDNLFWFRQRVLQYGENARVLSPEWLAEQIKDEYQRAYIKYCS